MNNSIDFTIRNNEEINFNVKNEKENIGFNTSENENVDITLGNKSEDVSMSIQDSGSNLNFQLRETPFATNNYKKLVNQPSINSVVLIDNKTSEDLGLQPAGSYANSRISNIEIDQLFR